VASGRRDSPAAFRGIPYTDKPLFFMQLNRHHKSIRAQTSRARLESGFPADFFAARSGEIASNGYGGQSGDP
jgi:hypothetical protein